MVLFGDYGVTLGLGCTPILHEALSVKALDWPVSAS